MRTVPKSSDKRATPERVIQVYLRIMMGLLVGTLVVSQIRLPYVGKTLWDLICGLVLGVPALVNTIASQFTFITGALGVLWLTHIYRRMRRAGVYRPRWRVDIPMMASGLGLSVLYFALPDQVLPLHANFFTRVALYCAISLMTFCAGVLLMHGLGVAQARTLAEPTGNERRNENPEFEEVVLFVFILICLGTGFATGFHGAHDSSVSFLGYQVPNALLHWLANFGGLGMGTWFYGTKKPATGEGEVPKQDDGPAHDTAAEDAPARQPE
jgi:hypothetical protein